VLAMTQLEMKEWCTEHDYELLELEKSISSDMDATEDDGDDDDTENNHRKKRRQAEKEWKTKTKQKRKRKRKRTRKKIFYEICSSFYISYARSVYPDVYGVPRLLQTLHVHQWPNIDLKGKLVHLKMFGRSMIINRFCSINCGS
jgi:hypothetical protein